MLNRFVISSLARRLLFLSLPSDLEQLERALAYLQLDIDGNFSADRFSVMVTSPQGRISLRQYMSQFSRSTPFLLSQFVDDVDFEDLDNWKCDPKEFFGHVIQHYDGTPNAWPNSEHVKKEFLNWDRARQADMMNTMLLYFKTGNSRAASLDHIRAYLSSAQHSLGTYVLKTRNDARPQAVPNSLDDSRLDRTEVLLFDLSGALLEASKIQGVPPYEFQLSLQALRAYKNKSTFRERIIEADDQLMTQLTILGEVPARKRIALYVYWLWLLNSYIEDATRSLESLIAKPDLQTHKATFVRASGLAKKLTSASEELFHSAW